MNGQTGRVLGTLFSVLAAGWLTIAPASADESYPLDDAKLDSFVMAATAVHEVVEASASKNRQNMTEEEEEALVQELETQLKAAIEDTDGITIAEYKEIHEAATKDEALGQRIMDKLLPATAGH